MTLIYNYFMIDRYMFKLNLNYICPTMNLYTEYKILYESAGKMAIIKR